MNQKEKAILYVVICVIIFPVIFGSIGYFLKIPNMFSNNNKTKINIYGMLIGILGVPFLIIFLYKIFNKKDEN